MDNEQIEKLKERILITRFNNTIDGRTYVMMDEVDMLIGELLSPTQSVDVEKVKSMFEDEEDGFDAFTDKWGEKYNIAMSGVAYEELRNYILTHPQPQSQSVEEKLKSKYFEYYKGILSDGQIEASWKWTLDFFLPYLQPQPQNISRGDVKITERGWAGHFIAGSRCRFRRNTLIEYGKKRVVVSTVGLLFLEEKSDKPQTLGIERYYETMAFKAKKEGSYWEADATKQVDFESNWCLDYYNDSSDNDANDMHDAIVKEIADGLKTQPTKDSREVAE
jgi:hypothetical protein